MKTILLTAALALAASSAVAGGSNANAESGSVSLSGSSVSIQSGDGHRWTGNVGLGVILNSENNSPCGRVTLGIPSSGKNCTTREEGVHLANAMMLFYSKNPAERQAGKIALWNACKHDTTMRETLIEAGFCRLK